MRRFVLDTGIASDYLFDRQNVPERVIALQARGNKVGVCIPVLCELWAGVAASKSRERNRKALLRGLRTLLIWPFDVHATEEYGRIFAILKSKGRPLPNMDIQIAAIALTLGRCTVVTKDKHFHQIPGLKVENWPTL